MTGLERLRELADDMYAVDLWSSIRARREDKYDTDEGDGKTVNGLLRAIADQIEAEQDERITRRVEDREGAEWVREHGGIAYVKDAWNVRRNLDSRLEKEQAKVERQQRHIEFVQGKCRERKERICELNRLNRAYRDALNGVCKRLGLTDGTGLPDMPEVIWTELDRRLMPEGMEWPRFEDGEPVRPGDKLLDKDGDWFEAVSFVFTCDWWSIRGYQAEGFGDMNGKTRRTLEGMSYGARVNRPAPKVLDADGVEIRVGDTVYHVKDGSEMTVYGIEGEWLIVSVGSRIRHDIVTHRAPVLAADGEPLDVGQTVWDANGDELVVGALEDGGHTVACRYADIGDGIPTHGMWSPSDLTHQRPVLDAEGVPIREGDTVWCVATDEELIDMSIIRACWSKMREKLTVKSFITDAHGDKWADFEETSLCAKTCYLTHQRPVLDADGVPIKKGDMVYLLPGKWCDEFPCLGFHGGDELEVFADGEPQHVAGGVQCRDKEKGSEFRGNCYPQPSQLTHTKPGIDTWERIEDDCTIPERDYYARHIGHDVGLKDDAEIHEAVSCDLVRRCRALAERERGE